MYVDVRDLAQAHVRSLTMSGAANQRIFVVAAIATEKAMGDVMKRNFPECAARLRSDLSSSTPPYEIGPEQVGRAPEHEVSKSR